MHLLYNILCSIFHVLQAHTWTKIVNNILKLFNAVSLLIKLKQLLLLLSHLFSVLQQCINVILWLYFLNVKWLNGAIFGNYKYPICLNAK